MTKASLQQVRSSRKTDLIEDVYKRPILDLVLAALLRPCFLGSEHSKPWLDNEDVLILRNNLLSDSVITHAIELYQGKFDTSTSALSRLRSNGLGRRVIDAILSKRPSSS
jgi:hypothetical protein